LSVFYNILFYIDKFVLYDITTGQKKTILHLWEELSDKGWGL